MNDDLRYPIGPLERKDHLSEEDRSDAMQVLEEAPARLRKEVEGLTDDQLDTPYREGGWTVRQVVHHLPDSHLNGYVRMKWALTEDEPTIKPYDQPSWAELPDARSAPVEVSLALYEAVHVRWLELLRALDSEDFSRKLVHPEDGELTVDGLLCIYRWHAMHHEAHITRLKKREGW